MNREQRRRRQRGRTIARDLARNYECPDCLADTRLTEQEPGLYVLQVAHDATCPTYLSKRRSTQG